MILIQCSIHQGLRAEVVTAEEDSLRENQRLQQVAEKFLDFPAGPRDSTRTKGPEKAWSPDKEP